MKALQTDGKISINKKGLDQMMVNSYHRFLITTNSVEGPVKTSKDDRQNVIVRCSDELKGNTDYFEKLYAYLTDENVIRTLYDHLMATPDMDKFHLLPLPKTEYQNELKKLSQPIIDQFMEYFTESRDDKEVELLGSELFKMFRVWCDFNNINYDVTNQKFGVRVKLLGIDGVTRGKHTKNGSTTIYNIKKMKAHFKL
jgi:hypothetical protein